MVSNQIHTKFQPQNSKCAGNLVLQTHGLCKQFHDANQQLTILNHINLEVYAGEMVAIMGASGSGKSTLLHILGLLDRATSGDVLIHGQSTKNISERQLSVIRNQ